MGNCCMYKERRAPSALYKSTQRDEPPEVLHHPATNNSVKENNRLNSSSSSGLQHIKEREPDDSADDPSAHPQTSTIFIMRSASEKHRKNHKRRRSHYDNHHHHYQHHSGGGSSQKFSSCSTILIDDSTVSQPNLKNMIRAVALAIYFHIKNRDHREILPNDDRALDVFDEKLNPVSKEPIPNDYFSRDPDHKTIYRFIRNLFHSAQLTAECAIVTLVYLERLLTYSDMELAPHNWKRAVLGAILLASKVWDDQAVWTVDYCQILKDITVENINELERQFLELLQFNINVSSSVYAKYYFDLRALAYAHDLSFPFEPLSKDRAFKLEAMSNLCEGRLKETRLCRSQSLDGITSNPRHSKAILS